MTGGGSTLRRLRGRRRERGRSRQASVAPGEGSRHSDRCPGVAIDEADAGPGHSRALSGSSCRPDRYRQGDDDGGYRVESRGAADQPCLSGGGMLPDVVGDLVGEAEQEENARHHAQGQRDEQRDEPVDERASKSCHEGRWSRRRPLDLGCWHRHTLASSFGVRVVGRAGWRRGASSHWLGAGVSLYRT